MTAAQIEHNPGLARYVGEVLLTFRMPGASLVPELQREAGRWLLLMNWDFEPAARELARMREEVLGDPGRLGRLLVTVAAERGTQFGPLSAGQWRGALDRLHGQGYGLIGEAFLESVGLSYLVEVRPANGSRATPDGHIRGLLRSWLARSIRLDMRATLTTRKTMD
jgi:hypothetical protein